MCKQLTNLQEHYKNHPQLIHAQMAQSKKDVSAIAQTFYLFDARMSVASMSMWLAKFGIDEPQIELVFKYEGKVFASKVDLNADRELFTDTNIHGGDADLRIIPAKHIL